MTGDADLFVTNTSTGRCHWSTLASRDIKRTPPSHLYAHETHTPRERERAVIMWRSTQRHPDRQIKHTHTALARRRRLRMIYIPFRHLSRRQEFGMRADKPLAPPRAIRVRSTRPQFFAITYQMILQNFPALSESTVLRQRK